MPITQIRTMTYNDEEVYARTHIQGVDGLGKASSTIDGLMSKEDKTKLDGLENFDPSVLTEATTSKSGIMSAADKTKLDGLRPFDPATLTNATASKAGLMSPADKAKLDKLNTNSKPSGTVNGGSSGSSGSSTSSSSQILNRNVNLWPTESQRVTLSKKLSECANGIVLVWRLDASDNLYHYQYVPKYHTNHTEAKVTEMIPTNVTSSTIEHCIKVVYIYDTYLVGVAENSSSSTKANKIRLHEILEF
ncbi:hypothetical protein N9R04_04140 [Staphylococcus sp. SQ8-PEA]|uniref:Uncharacterized protein n=1 Tax=Staphylococcus marylandisciuri TaxID=2981529 RepID=A0ABT2QPM7_9STAP|nr:hypothetical protein [Staphylococcus marylandisciuri]MCU5745910.1 hypothetical protein [Staphylococcus marylandisciuri]